MSFGPRLELVDDRVWDRHAADRFGDLAYKVKAYYHDGTIRCPASLYVKAMGRRWFSMLLLAHEYRHWEGMSHPIIRKTSKVRDCLNVVRFAFATRFGLDNGFGVLRLFAWPGGSWRDFKSWLSVVDPTHYEAVLGGEIR